MQVVGGKVGVVVRRQSRNELDDGPADERITMILEGEDLVADFRIPVVHELEDRLRQRGASRRART